MMWDAGRGTRGLWIVVLLCLSHGIAETHAVPVNNAKSINMASASTSKAAAQPQAAAAATSGAPVASSADTMKQVTSKVSVISDAQSSDVPKVDPPPPLEIDIVYTFVNGSDPEWKAQRADAVAKDNNQHTTVDANKEFRYSYHNELKFSLKSVRKFAPWVRKVFLVVGSASQVPQFEMDPSRVQVVYHDQIFPKDHGMLPTFNSFAIEVYMHKIPGLAEHFLMMNDDMMFAAPVQPSDFFSDEGKPRIAFQRDWAPIPKHKPTTHHAYKWAAYQVDQLLDHQFFPEERRLISHQAYPVTKSLYERAHELYQVELFRTANHRFRAHDDVIPQFLAMWTGIYEQKAVRLTQPQEPSSLVLTLSDDLQGNVKKIEQLLEAKEKPKLLCTNPQNEKHESEVDTQIKSVLSIISSS